MRVLRQPPPANFYYILVGLPHLQHNIQKMSEFRKLDGILPSVSAEDFFARFVSTRTPVVIQGLPDDAAFKARSWVRLVSP